MNLLTIHRYSVTSIVGISVTPSFDGISFASLRHPFRNCSSLLLIGRSILVSVSRSVSSYKIWWSKSLPKTSPVSSCYLLYPPVSSCILLYPPVSLYMFLYLSYILLHGSGVLRRDLLASVGFPVFYELTAIGRYQHASRYRSSGPLEKFWEGIYSTRFYMS